MVPQLDVSTSRGTQVCEFTEATPMHSAVLKYNCTYYIQKKSSLPSSNLTLPDFRKHRERITSALYNTEHAGVHLTAKFQEQSPILHVHRGVSGWNPCHSTQLKFRHLKPQSSWFLTQFNTIVGLWSIPHSTICVTSHRQPMFRWPVSGGLTNFFEKCCFRSYKHLKISNFRIVLPVHSLQYPYCMAME